MNDSHGDRTFLLLLILTAWGLTTVLVVAGFVWPHGLLDVSGPLAAIFSVGLIAVVGGLTMTFCSLVASNPSVGPVARQWWTAAFVLAGPVAFPTYWLAHVAPTVRPHRARPASLGTAR